MELGKDKIVSEIISRLKDATGGNRCVKVDGTWGSFAPALAAHISENLKRPILYISPHIDDADNVADDLSVFAAGKDVRMFPVWEGRQSYQQQTDATDEIGSERIRIALSAAAEGGESDLIISTCVQALNQPVPEPEFVRGAALELKTGQTIEPVLVAGWLTDNGFERVDSVDLPGQFAHRGGIIDIFSPVTMSLDADTQSASEPVRVEFFGDVVESIRGIDLDTQRSSRPIGGVRVVSTAAQRFDRTALFLNLLPAETIMILTEPVETAEVSDVFLSRVDDARGLYPWEAIYKAAGRFTRVEISRFAAGADDEYLHLDVTSASEFEQKSTSVWKSKKAVLEQLIEQAGSRCVLLYCENAAEIQRVTEIIKETHKHLPANFMMKPGFVHQGFIIDSLDTIVISHHEIFGQHAVRRRIRSVRATSPVESLLDLQKGDYVVHLSYGIGRFRGVQMMERAGVKDEYLTIEYADKHLVHVPVRNISLVQKYVGALPRRPKLSKIGSKKWERQKEAAEKGIEELAVELLETQAKRQSLGGYSFGPDTAWQKEFEESFVYQETPDQLKTAEQIKDDMTKAYPMDRLLCGDVGYGKTELAMRAAFKAVAAGKQVAVLVPTTVLCVQHGRTFSERFADFPVTVGVLNRFVSPKQAKEVIAGAKKGTVDIIIGTHRLLSDDVGFKDIGLLIIDEEQRFGVAHKEKLKRFRINVDVLTMTATPIPRTLHMSLLGLRDISSLATPPLDRRSIVTKVARSETGLIRGSILAELNRQGQVFYVYNRVRSIERAAEDLRKIISDSSVRIDIAHGQMAKHELEDAMVKFVVGQTDVLVCSTIIESGIDIPNANTMIVCDSDRFGLAQLHQLRGRVGRYKHRAYAYMLLPASRTITPTAARRLKAIEEYSQLGAGFRIALRDLEIRGAGNILGPQQSGNINMVGYEMYCRLLAQAVRKLKNEPVEEIPTAVIELGFSTYIPKSYVPAEGQRMDVYRRIAAAQNPKELDLLCEEMADLFGPVPEQVKMLIDMTELKIYAWQRGIKSIVISGRDVIFSLGDGADTKELFAKSPGRVSIPDAQTVYMRLETNYFEPTTLVSILRKLLAGKQTRISHMKSCKRSEIC